MRRVSLSSVAATAVVLVGGCGEDRGLDRPGVTVRDSSGIRIAELEADVCLATRALTADPSWPQARDLSFGDLLDVHLLRDGRAVLLDGMTGQVTVLSAEGATETQFGGLGEGPGEFSPFGLRNVASTDSTILIPDIQLQRITEFSMSGEVLATHRMLDPSRGVTVGYAVDWRGHPGGGLAARILSESGDAIVRLKGEVLDTLYAELISGRERGPLLFPTLVWDIDSGERIIVGRSDRWEVRRWDPRSGESRWMVRQREGQRRMTEAQREHLGDLFISMIEEDRGGTVPEGQRAAILASVQFPTHAPMISAVYASPEGRYWVQEARKIEDMGRDAMRVGAPELVGDTLWWVLTQDGLLAERVVLPEGFTPRRFEGRWIYGISEDRLGVQGVARVSRE